VFRRYNNSKRVTALLGVVLALLPSVQHLHLVCVLGGCATSSLQTACCEHVNSETKTCSHAHSCKSTQACKSTRDTAVPSSLDGGTDKQNSSCPCPQSCWCHQTPQPFELPRCPSEPIELLLQSIALSDATIGATLDLHQTRSYDGTSAIAASSESSVQRCAQLCRFLI